MHYRHLIEGCFAERIGTGGVSAAGFADWRAAADAEHQRIRQTSEPEMAAVLALPGENRRHRSNSRCVRASIEWLYKHLGRRNRRLQFRRPDTL